MRYTPKFGMTWDIVARELLGDEFAMMSLLEANAQYSDVVTFEGTETLEIPEMFTADYVMTSNVATTAAQSVISAPWEV